MTTKELAQVIGKSAFLHVENVFLVPVTVEDAKMSYGQVRYQVTPVGGSGASWVDSSRVKVGA